MQWTDDFINVGLHELTKACVFFSLVLDVSVALELPHIKMVIIKWLPCFNKSCFWFLFWMLDGKQLQLNDRL